MGGAKSKLGMGAGPKKKAVDPNKPKIDIGSKYKASSKKEEEAKLAIIEENKENSIVSEKREELNSEGGFSLKEEKEIKFEDI